MSRRTLLAAGGVGAVAVAGGAFFLLGDGGNEEIRAVIQENARTLENGAVDRHMATMHPDSPIYDQTRSQVEALLREVPAEALQIDVTVNSVDVPGDGRAEAEAVQTTRADIPDFQDNRTDLVHDLRTDQDDWKLYNSTVESVERL